MTRSRRYAGTDMRVRMCHSKRRMTARDAHKTAQKYGMRSYHCPICGQYHIARKVDAAAE
jgi:predicted RNA-binding Zn-ribbon protein involved in translation (DUF1610 family)